jgi:hypothetical protein
MTRVRLPRALELYERALALAEMTSPESTLLVAALLEHVLTTRITLAVGGSAYVADATGAAARIAASWRDDEQLMRLSQRCLGLLRQRWHASTLMTLTPAELCYLEAAPIPHTPETLGVELFAAWAVDALMYWPHASATLAAGADCLHGVHEALRAVLAMQTMQPTRSVLLGPAASTALCFVLQVVLNDASWLHRLRTTCGLSQADEAKLRELHQKLAQGHDALVERSSSARDALGERAAADVARHGLRSCALPTCGATEQYPKTYKLCGRCRGVAYCCAAHSKEDWKRHKREDGCAAPPS